MSNLVTSPIELVSTFRPAAKNGPPSSNDYNDTQRSILSDLHSIEEFLNQVVIPVLSSLPDEAAYGLDGRTMYASSNSDNPLFYDNTTGSYLTVAQVLQNFNNSVAKLAQKIHDINSRVISLNSKLATTNQTDMVTSVQGFLNQMRTLSYQVAQLSDAGTAQASVLSKSRASRETVTLDSNGEATVEITWVPAFSADTYTVSLAIEAANPAALQWSKTASTVTVAVTGTPSETVTIHATAKAD